MNIRKQAYKRAAYGTKQYNGKCQMSTGQLLLSSPSFLDIARLRTGLSLVWCAKTKNKKSFKHQWKTKAGVPVKVTDKNMKQTNIKNTTVLALTRCPLDWAKNKENTQQMTGKSRLSSDQQVLFLFPLREKKTKQRPRKDPKTVSQSVPMFPCPIHCEHVCKKEWRNHHCGVRTPRFHIYSERTGGWEENGR